MVLSPNVRKKGHYVLKRDLLRATSGARNPNLNVAIEHARHVCWLMVAQLLWTSVQNE